MRSRPGSVARFCPGEMLSWATITMDVEGDELTVRWENPAGEAEAAEEVGAAA